MNWFFRTFSYSIGRKIIMSLTGLFLVLYLIEHLIGNSLLLLNDNGEAFNGYSHFMVHNPIIRVIEYVLFACFFFHIVDGVVLWLRNRRSRPVRYAMNKPSGNSKWSSRNMIVSGSIVFIFLIIHLKTFFVPYRIMGQEMNLYETAVAAFSNLWYTIFYVFAMILVGFHLNHGFASAFQTIGVRHPKYYPFLNGLGVFLSIVMAAGFAIIPIFLYLQK